MNTIKCVIVGDGDADKTQLCISYTTGRIPTKYIPTVFDNYSVTVMINGEPYTLGLFDTAGQEDYVRLRPLSYPQTDVFMVVFSVVNPYSLENVKEKWVPEITHHCPGTPFFLIGNKASLRDDPITLENLKKSRQKPVLPEEGINLAKTLGAVKYMECDHETGYQVKDIFDEAILAALVGPTGDSGGSKAGSFFRNIISKLRGKKKPNEKEVNNGQQNSEVVVPDEILDMGEVSVEMYIKALEDGKEQVYDIRLMVVGAYGVGKTTLTKRLLKNKVNISSRDSTNGIDVHVHRCAIKVPTGEWIFDKEIIDGKDHLVRIAKLIENASKEKLTNVSDHQNTEKSNIKAIQEGSKTVEGSVADEKDTAMINEGKESLIALGGGEGNTEKLHFRQASTKDFESSFESLQKKVEKLDIDEEKRKEILTAINNTMRDMRSSNSQHKQDMGKVSIWDFGGQLIFYSTHQVFLSARAIYIIVVDLSKSLGDSMEDECFQDVTGLQCSSFKDRLIFWLNSIHTYSMDDDDSIPPVLLVATHLDKVKGKKMDTVRNFFTEIRKVLADKPFRFHVIDEDFAIDNTKSDPRLDDLRRKIYEIASKQKHWGEEIPARWINLENALMKHKSEGHKLISFDDVKQMNGWLAVSITHEEELLLFLRFEHEIGNIIFFDDESLKKFVVLQPQWLIDAFKCIITSKEFCIKSAKLAHFWYEFFDRAILREDLVDHVWKKEKLNLFYENKTHILNLMEKMDILARPSIYPETRSTNPVCVNYHLAPCMLNKTISNNELIQATAGSKALPFLCYEFSDKFVPPAVFHRLLAACMGKWPVVQRKEQLMLFCGFGLFYITDDRCNRLLLSSVQHVIQIRLFHYGNKSDLDADIAVSVREFITRKINSIIRLYHRRMPYELCMKCEKSDYDTLEGMLKVNDLLKFKCVTCDNHETLDSHAVESSTLLNVWCSDLQMHEKVYGYKGRDVFKDDLQNPEALLQHNVARHGMVFRQDTLHGGSSFFHAISDQLVRLNLPFKDPVILRQSVVKYMRNLEKNAVEKIKANIGDNFDSYLTNMLQTGTAAAPVAIQCTAQLLNKKIVIASSSYEADRTEVREQIVNAGSTDEGPPMLIGQINDDVYQSLGLDKNFSAASIANNTLKKQIRRNYKFLVQNTDLLSLTDVLLEEDIFSLNERELVENANPSTTERRNRILLDLLMKKKERAIPIFLQGLKDMGHEDIVKRIRKTCITENYHLADKRKDAELKERIRRNYEMLVMDTILENKVDEFYSQGLFSLTEKEIVENAQPNTVENKNRLFLEIFLIKRNDSAHVLMNTFNEEGREDIVQKINEDTKPSEHT